MMASFDDDAEQCCILHTGMHLCRHTYMHLDSRAEFEITTKGPSIILHCCILMSMENTSKFSASSPVILKKHYFSTIQIVTNRLLTCPFPVVTNVATAFYARAFLVLVARDMARANWYLAIASFILWFVTQSTRRQNLQNPKIPVFCEEY